MTRTYEYTTEEIIFTNFDITRNSYGVKDLNVNLTTVYIKDVL